jgi:hypothetical protein
VQWAFERSELLDSAMANTSTVVGGLLFVAAGCYQWTRLKDVCLTQCQKPFAFLMRQGGFRGDAPGSLMLGVRHGAYCVGCCWALMALLLVGGVMNVLWIVLLALLILLEKVIPFGRQIALLAGMVLIAGGLWLFSMGMSQPHPGRQRNVSFWHKRTSRSLGNYCATASGLVRAVGSEVFPNENYLTSVLQPAVRQEQSVG